jgi:trans-aconitate methyltransferase
MSDNQVLDKHYRRLGPSYSALLTYSPDFVRTLTTKMVDKLRLAPDDLLVDLGCGTGIYAVDLLQQVPLSRPIIGVDPYPEMLAGIPDGAPIDHVCDDALSFSRRADRYDKVLIKETIHHVAERDELFANLFERLSPGGVLLLVHVPPRVEYPLFEAALERCLGWHADPDELVRQLEGAGFGVERDTLEYRHNIPKDHYFDMVRSCYMSVLTSFSDDELAAGLEEMAATHAERDVLSFIDRFDYLTATKSSG